MIIAQISDTHILAPSSGQAVARSRADSLRRCIADINRLRPDAVVHTGDIVQNGRPGEYAHVRELLAPLEAPLYIIPGNRDDREALRDAFSDHAYLPQTGEFLHYTIEDYLVRIVALDSIVPGQRKGAFCGRRLAWLERVLEQAPGKPTLLLIHQPPFDIGTEYVGGYCRPGETEELAAVVGRHPQVQRLLCGHLHHPVHEHWGGTLATTMPSIALDVRKGVDAGPVKDATMYQVHVMSGQTGLISHTRIVTA
jgi:3',5'-cyclic AMP phosphodiesterase CpdA